MAETITIPGSDADMRLDRWLKNAYPALTQGMVQKWLRTGQIRVNGKRSDAAYRTVSGDEIRLPPQLQSLEEIDKSLPKMLTVEELRIFEKMIVFENKDMIAIDKPAGLAVQGGSKTQMHLDLWLKQRETESGEPLRLVHRLDKDTSGIMILAKTRKAASDFGALFRQQKIEKTYVALLDGVPEVHEATVNAPLSKLPSYRGEQMSVDEEDGKSAITDYEIIDFAGHAASVVRLSPRTGRTHQLRVHMALLETPILGDRKYGHEEPTIHQIPKNLYLHAHRLVVPGQVLTAPLPPHFKKAMDYFGFDAETQKKFK